MKRLARFLSCVFLFLTIASGLMWVRSYFYWEAMYNSNWKQGQLFLGSDKGVVFYNYMMFPRLSAEKDRLELRSIEYVEFPPQLPSWWFKFVVGHNGTIWQIEIPYWVLFFSSLTLCYWSHRYALRQPRGHCQSCGYDLRGSGEVCPECGAAKA